MAGKPLTTEAMAIAEKKMDMTLDDIIKMSKKAGTKANRQPRTTNKSHRFSDNAVQQRSARIRRFMDSRSSLRQGVLAQRRSKFQGSQFPSATEVAIMAAAAPFPNKAFIRNRRANRNRARASDLPVQRRANGSFGLTMQKPPQQQKQEGDVVPKKRPQTLDLRFASMKEERMRVLSCQNNAGRRSGGSLQRPRWLRGLSGK